MKYTEYTGITCGIDSDYSSECGIAFNQVYAHIYDAVYVNDHYYFNSTPKKERLRPKRFQDKLGSHIFSQMAIPRNIAGYSPIDRMRLPMDICALLRLRRPCQAYPSIVSNIPFNGLRTTKGKMSIAYYYHGKIHLHLLDPTKSVNSLSIDDLKWSLTNLSALNKLKGSSKGFKIAFDAFEMAEMEKSTEMSLLRMWSGLEGLLGPINNEISFRISVYFASLLAPRGEERHAIYRKIKNLYVARSKVAHGSGEHDYKNTVETYALIKNVLLKIIENGHVPKTDECDRILLM